jgi:hypothetical protein
MPRYVYRCTVCEELSNFSHGAEEIMTRCEKCSAPEGLVRLLTSFSTRPQRKAPKSKVGQVTEEFIKSSRADLALHKRERLKKKEK